MKPYKSVFLAAAAVLIFGAAVNAGHYSDLYVIPVAGHTPGAFGTVWRSDVAIYNFQPTPLEVELVFIEGGEGNPDNVFPLDPAGGTVTVPSGGSVLLEDVLNDFQGRTSVVGALLLGADRPFVITSRAYDTNADGDTVGQSVPASSEFLNVTEDQTDLASAFAYVPGLIQNADFRTNLGFVAANATGLNGPLTLDVTLRNAVGTVLGMRQFVIQPGMVTQFQFSVKSITDQDFDIGSAEFRIASGSGSVVPYASVIDNGSADAVYIQGRFPGTESVGGHGFSFPSAFELLLERARSSW